jgi:hypothetical protein
VRWLRDAEVGTQPRQQDVKALVKFGGAVVPAESSAETAHRRKLSRGKAMQCKA